MPLDDALVDEMFERAARAWPGVALDRAKFRAALEERVANEADSAAAAAKIHGDDLFLAVACEAADPRALAHFERAFMTAIPRAIAHVAKDDGARDEVAQRLRQKLFVASDGKPPKIADYGARGPLGGWLRVAAVREALNLRRDEARGESTDDDGLSFEEVDRGAPRADDPELALVRARYGHELAAAFKESVAELPEDDRTMLRMHYIDGLDIEAIGRVFAVHRSTASRWLAKTRAAVLAETRKRVRARLRVSSSEVESVLRLAQSDFDFSLHRAFGSRSLPE